MPIMDEGINCKSCILKITQKEQTYNLFTLPFRIFLSSTRSVFINVVSRLRLLFKVVGIRFS